MEQHRQETCDEANIDNTDKDEAIGGFEASNRHNRKRVDV